MMLFKHLSTIKNMRVAVLFSGGKDSTMALYDSLQKGMKVKYLVSIFSKNPESYMFHYPNMSMAIMQSLSIGIRLVTKKTEGKKEKELEDLKNVLESLRGEIEGVVVGAIASKYQKDRVSKICKSLKLKMIAPLWGKKPDFLWKRILDAGFEVMITSVSADGLGKEWLGRIIDKKNLEKLKKMAKKYKIHLSGEGGEFETLVLNGPIFKRRLEIISSEVEWDGDSGRFVIKDAKLKGGDSAGGIQESDKPEYSGTAG
jgi:ABC transporter with metal-binding/Fe-S-binding domain ATP-binding protein